MAMDIVPFEPRQPPARQRLAASPLGRLLGHGVKQAGVPGANAGWHSITRGLRGGVKLPRGITNLLNTYGGYEEGVVWVYACATKIATELAGYPWDIYNEDDELIPPEEVPPELADLLDRPNRLMTYTTMVNFIGLDLELAGNSYWLKDRRNGLGQPFELRRLRPELVRRAVNPQGDAIGHVYELQGRQIPYSLDEVIWLRYPNPKDELYGMGTVEAIQRELGADLAISEHVVGFYSSGGRISGVLTIRDNIGQDQFERLQQQFEEEEAAGADNRFSVLIAEQGVEYTPITQPPAGTGVVELRRMSKDVVLTAFEVPEPVLGGVLENANYKITDSRYVFTQNVSPKATLVSEQFTIELVQLWEGRQYRMTPQVNLPAHERAAMAKNSVGTGLSLNQLLDMQGLPLIDDEAADEPLLVGTVKTYSQIIEPPAPPQPPQVPQPPRPGGDEFTPPGDEGDVEPGEGDEAQEREEELGLRGRVARKVLAPRPAKRTPAGGFRLGKTRRRGTGSGAGVRVVQGYVERKELPPPPQQDGHAPLWTPPMPDGWEQLGMVVLKQADATAAVRLLAHRAGLLRTEVPHFQAQVTQFFIGQQQRILRALEGYSGEQRHVRRGKRELKELTGQSLWDDAAENDALLDVYLPLVDRLGTESLNLAGEVVGTQLRWDLAVKPVARARQQLARKITRVNDTTKYRIAAEVEEGLRRGYSVTQIANGVVQAEYRGVMGVFDEATRYRAEMIARTETAAVYNTTANVGYRDAGVQQVEVIDGTGDAICAGASGSVWSLDDADKNPIGHPNCVRAFAPIIGAAAA